jgi:predicted ester cyclase
VSDRAERNKQVILRHFLEALGQGRPEIWLEIMHPDYVIHHPWAKPGRDAYIAANRKFWSAFSPPAYEVLHLIAEGDFVMIHYIERATMTAPMFGVEASGQSYEKQGFALYRLEDGLMREAWAQEDDQAFMRQLGVTELKL